MKKPIIQVKNISKKFIIPHEKENSLKSTLINSWKKKTYETFYALKNISFSINPGEFIGIIGRNGSGKSTLLKILAGIYKSDSGTISVNGKTSPFLELGVGFNGELSGRDNIYLYGAVLGLSKKEIDKRYKKILEFAELEKFIDTKLKNYSSGMQVRLAFSVAIQSSAPILIVDEVLAVGDADFQKKCFNVFKRYKEEGKTVIFVSHDLSSVEKWCDKCILLDNNKVIKNDKPKKVINYYKYEILKEKKEKNLAIKIIKEVKKEFNNNEKLAKEMTDYKKSNNNLKEKIKSYEDSTIYNNKEKEQILKERERLLKEIRKIDTIYKEQIKNIERTNEEELYKLRKDPLNTNIKEKYKRINEIKDIKDNKEYSIKNFRILNNEGNDKKKFSSDEKITFEFNVNANNDSNNFNIGVQIFTKSGIELIGFSNSFINKKLILKKGLNKIRFTINKLLILSGKFLITYALYKKMGNRIQHYHYSGKNDHIVITSDKVFEGILDVDIEFKN